MTVHRSGKQRREFEELVARQAAVDQSGAIKINTGLIGDVVDIGNGIIQGAQGIKNFFTCVTIASTVVRLY